MIKVLSFSLVLSLVSVIIIVLIPFTVSQQGSKLGPSPYRAQIDELYLITSKGIPPNAAEWQQLEDLKRKNNEWFNSKGDEFFSENLTTVEIIKLKSQRASLILFVCWGLGFYFYFRSKINYLNFLVLLFPVVLFALNIISILAFLSIFTGVFSVFVYLIRRKNRDEKPF
jgi:hypothetical protein